MEHKTRCSNVQYLIEFFINLGASESQLFKGVKTAKSFISKPHNWLGVEDFHQIIKNCQESNPYLTLDDWQKVAHNIKDNEATGIWRTIVKLIGIKTLYSLTPRYIKNFNTYSDLKINSISKNSVDFLIILNPNVNTDLLTRWTAGILQTVPCVLGLPAAKTHILFDQCELKSIITNLYKKFNIAYKEENNIIYANKKILGKRVRLKQKIENGRTVCTNKFSYEKPHNAILITNDLTINDIHLIKKGDIFNAPYGRVVLTWQKPEKVLPFESSKKLKEDFIISFNEQLHLADERYFQSELLRKQEQEKNIELRKALDDLQTAKNDKNIKPNIINNLTPSEIKIVKLIQEGKSSKEISVLLNISLRTVENHRANIRKKLNLSNKKINLSSHLMSIK